MIHDEGQLEGVGGLRLYRQAWLPDGDVRAVVVLSHGASEHSTRYAWVAEQLTGAGYAVHAVDHRGHGRSAGDRAYIERVAHVVTDLDRLVDVAAQRHPGLPVFLLGHSMGGLVATAYALEHQHRLSGLVLTSPLAALEAAPLPLRLACQLLSVVAPKVGVYQVDSGAVSNDAAVVRDYEADPLVHHGKLPARTVAELAGTVGGFPERIGRITIPLLVMATPDDRITPFAGAEMVHATAGSADKSFVRYDGLAHEILNEPEREKVVGEIIGWLGQRAGARVAPAGAPAAG